MPRPTQQLHRLARLHGLQTAYYDVGRQRRTASTESLLSILRAMRVEIDSVDDASEALRRGWRDVLDRGVEPVVVAWDGEAADVSLCLPARATGGRLAWRLELEAGETLAGEASLAEPGIVNAGEVVAEEYGAYPVPLPGGLPTGYHTLTVEAAGRRFESLVISAPRQAFVPQDRKHSREWGCFLPLYSLYSQRSWGAGDFSDLEALVRWIGELGGGLVGTLPLLPAALDEPFDPSPYSPVSRLFWNEFYIDVERIPELQQSAEARRLLESSETTSAIAEMRGTDRLDYRRQMALKRRILEVLADEFFEHDSPRLHELARHMAGFPALEDYATFRAAWEKHRTWWPEWPAGPSDGSLTPDDYDERARRFYLYAQWVASGQMESLERTAHDADTGLYLDLPLGVRMDGYDVWRHRAVYVTGATAGAPPDVIFTKGQNWGFCPLHPEAVRTDRYRHFRDFIGHHLKHSRVLRIDHVMGLHRLYWVPQGMSAVDGVYVQYPAEELYAVLSVESHRHRAAVVGENLGTVPSYVNQAMNRHQVRRMYVVQYEFQSGSSEDVLKKVPRASVASINTHDMPPFAAWWNGDDITDRQDLGLITDEEVAQEQAARRELKQRLAAWLQREGRLEAGTSDLPAVTRGLLDHLAAGPAGVVLVNLEDLWEETRSQNVPGTWMERPNWRRKARHSFEEFRDMPKVIDTLRQIDRLRRTKESRRSVQKTATEQ